MSKLKGLLDLFNTTGRVGRIFSCLCSVCAIVFFLTTTQEVAFFGFPDSHVTDFQKAVTGPLTILSWVSLALCPYFAVTAAAGHKLKTRPVIFVCVLALFIAVMAIALLAVPWYFGTYLNLDNGIGG